LQCLTPDFLVDSISDTAALVEWNFNLGVAAGCCCIHRHDSSINIAVDGGPLGIAKDDDGNPAAF
jgi:hypothetical protein